MPEILRERLVGRMREFVGGYSATARLYRRFRPRWFWKSVSPLGRPTTRYVSENGLGVRRGPFSGLVFRGDAPGRVNYLSSKLAGTYEPEVTGFLAEHVMAHDLFVDLGSADGYFCVGTARLKPLRSIGFELNSFERKMAQKLAVENEVAIETRGAADVAGLNSLPLGRLLLLCDVEGLEEDLLDPALVPRLATATMVVEAHEQFRPNVVTTLTERFRHTHEVTHVKRSDHPPPELSEFAAWEREMIEPAVWDGHAPGDGWMTFVPHRLTD